MAARRLSPGRATIPAERVPTHAGEDGRRLAGDMIMESAAETAEWLEPGDKYEKGWTHATYLQALQLRGLAEAPPLPLPPPPPPPLLPHVCPCGPPGLTLDASVGTDAATPGASSPPDPPAPVSPRSEPGGNSPEALPAPT